ncbi:MAG: glycolate oxidase subunit GlcF [Gammaproteobacteria bacterium]
MRAILAADILPADDLADAQSILRACVHCGFCNATCPSYQVLGDEQDGPRGRIYLMKHLLEGGDVTASTRTHLDRCLGCRACETTCPSGVRYTRLLELVRPEVDRAAPRGVGDRVVRWLLRRLVSSRARFGALLAVGRMFRGVLPRHLRQLIPARRKVEFQGNDAPRSTTFLALEGCVQEAAAPEINRAAECVLGAIGIGVKRVPSAGCCGALPLHLGATTEAEACARRNIDAWWPLIARGEVAGVVSASSGCTQVLQDYGHLLRHDPRYADRARRLAAVVRDAAELVEPTDLAAMPRDAAGEPSLVTLAFQAPCSLQHGLRAHDRVERALRAVGYGLVPVPDGHLCCGSAGTYSLLQPKIAGELRERKLEALEASAPSAIATANVGCLLHLQQAATIPVRHWLELIADRIAGCSRTPAATPEGRQEYQ